MKEIGSRGGRFPSAPLNPPMLMNINEGLMFKLGKCSVMQWLSYWSWKIPTFAVDLNFPHGSLTLQSGPNVTWAKILIHNSETQTWGSSGADPGGAPGARPPLDPRFWGPKIEHFWALFKFSIIFLPRFTRHIISLICSQFKFKIFAASLRSAYDLSPRSVCF